MVRNDGHLEVKRSQVQAERTLGDGRFVAKSKFSRQQLLAYTATLSVALIGVEARSGARFICAALRDHGHDVRLIPAQLVKPSPHCQ